jgi:Zn-dependent M28 family amino/carboxypeptidase
MGDHPRKPGSNRGVVVPMDRIPVPGGCGIPDQVGSRNAQLAAGRVPVSLGRRFCPLGDWVGIGDVGDQEQRGGVGHRADVVDYLDIEIDEGDASTFSNATHLAHHVHLGLDADTSMPGEGLLAVDHRPVGELAEQVGCHDKKQSCHEPGRCSILPTFRVITGDPHEIVDVLDTDTEMMRADWLIDEVGRVQVFHGNGDGVWPRRDTGWESVIRRYMRRSFRKLVVLASILALLGATAPVASAAPAACENRNNNTIEKLLECVDVEGVREHQAAFQAIADANGGTRASGTSGYDESAAYVAERMEAAGYDVTIQPFDFVRFTELSPAILEQVAPAQGAGPIPNIVMSYSGSVDIAAAPVTVVPNVGCDTADFTGFPAGTIALISRGTCAFAIKATNAATAGAAGVVIYNNIAGDLNGTLGSTFTLDIGVTGITQALGQQLAATPGLVLRLKTDTLREPGTTSNVLAEKVGKNPDNVVMVGAHLDSVPEGPGINDNGSGSGAILEVAEQMAKVKPQNTLRFAWWGAEEASLVGSNLYVNTLSDEEFAKIALYLNFDMVGSKNHVFFVYDGDNSDAVGAGPGPAGSAQIEKKFEEFYNSRNVPFKGTDFDGRSDYQIFILNGIPAGGLFTGAEGRKTEAEVVLWGGTAGQQYDPCYHAACDTFDNVNLDALDTNSDAIAYTTLSYAMSTEEINGVPGKGNFKAQQLDEEATPDAA